MRQFLTLSAALALAVSTSAFAAPAKEASSTAGAMTPQQTRMGDCNKQAAGKKGDDRKAFMKTCLSGDTAAAAAPAAPMTQQDKMKKCSGDNKGKKGAEYKSAMKICLSA